MNKKLHHLCFLLLLFCFGSGVPAQENPEDIALVDLKLEDDFYEALQQRGIENFDKAIVALQRCLVQEPNNPAFLYELGKNQLDVKNYVEAETAFKQAIELDRRQRWYWNGLYDLYYQTKDFQKAIPVVQTLITFDPNMREDLVSLYLSTNQKENALALLKELEASTNLTRTMEFYKLKLEASEEFAQPKKDLLEAAIKKNPNYEQNYIDLIVLYSSFNQEDKAFEVAKQLQQEIPSSDWAHVSLVKFYINNNEGGNAAKSMFRVFENDKMDLKIKHRIFNEFLIFAIKNPNYFAEVDAAIPYFDNDPEIAVAKEVAKFFWKKMDYEKSRYYFEKAIHNNPEDIESCALYLEALLQQQDFQHLVTKAGDFSELYPTQAQFYLYAGIGYNQLKNFKKAVVFLESGLDFVMDDRSLEATFYKQLQISFENLNDSVKAAWYSNQLKRMNE